MPNNYLLSFPERLVRSAAALIGGASLVVTNTLLPDTLRATTTYRVFIGDFQKLLITRIAQVPLPELIGDPTQSEAYTRKKIAGGVLETASILAVRFSPVWLFAIISDAAGGSKTFLLRLVDNLKANGVLDPAANPANVAELLEAIQNSSQASTRAIDTPPLSAAELAQLRRELSATYGQVLQKSQALLPRVERLGSEMEVVAAEEDLTYEQLSGLMAVEAVSWAQTGLEAGLTVGQTGGELFVEQILAAYGRTLSRLRQQGAGAYLSDTLLPFLGAAVYHFDPGKTTWTESKLLPRQNP